MPRDSYLDPAARNKFRRALMRWYEGNRRDLPWRRTTDPYRIWISEVMLQQTRVAAVLEHYAAFLKTFPNVAALARARESAVLAVWSGLGYYRRARALHQAARKVALKYGGRLPRTAAALRELPGIGPYTSNAIASIAYGEPVPVVDGNVERVLTRFTGQELTRQQLWSLSEELLHQQVPGDFNQALMELGATLCTPQTPNCGKCPIRALCGSRGQVERKKLGSKAPAIEVGYALTLRRGSVYLVRRPATVSLMPGMWELPVASSGKCITRLKHSITNRTYAVSVFDSSGGHEGGKWISLTRVHTLPLTGLTRKILRVSCMGISSKTGRRKRAMRTLQVGKIAPELELPGVRPGNVSLKQALQEGPVVLAFFKISCPVCQYAFPFLERLHRNYPSSRVRFIGVSQDDEQATRMFMREFGVTFTIAMDRTGTYPISNAYGITNVPTTFYIAQDGEVQLASVGWVRADMQKLNEMVADHIGSGAVPLFQAGEQVIDFRAG